LDRKVIESIKRKDFGRIGKLENVVAGDEIAIRATAEF
jgi:hypothetical protein